MRKLEGLEMTINERVKGLEEGIKRDKKAV
jgi:hypothetical protein